MTDVITERVAERLEKEGDKNLLTDLVVRVLHGNSEYGDQNEMGGVMALRDSLVNLYGLGGVAYMRQPAGDEYVYLEPRSTESEDDLRQLFLKSVECVQVVIANLKAGFRSDGKVGAANFGIFPAEAKYDSVAEYLRGKRSSTEYGSDVVSEMAGITKAMLDEGLVLNLEIAHENSNHIAEHIEKLALANVARVSGKLGKMSVAF